MANFNKAAVVFCTYPRILTVLTVLVFLCYFLIPMYVSNISVDMSKMGSYAQCNKLFSNESTKYILYWNDFFGWKNMSLGLGRDMFKKCDKSDCLATNNYSLLPLEQFDAIIFHAPTFYSDEIPSKRCNFQKYIYFSWESPLNNPVIKLSKKFYNWTMTYRKDSDIYVPYRLIEKRKTNYIFPPLNITKSKRKMVAWFNSNCHTEASKFRTNYVNELRKYIEIDIYGKCGNFVCPRSNATQCFKMLEKNYYFSLAFENSMCLDYVTEKMFQILNYDVVPVVLGYGDYKNIAPPKAAINAFDYANPKALATYLLHLSKNIEQYIKYFEWKKNFVVISSRESAVCQLCKKLHEPIQYSSYDNLYEWSLGRNKNICNTTAIDF